MMIEMSQDLRTIKQLVEWLGRPGVVLFAELRVRHSDAPIVEVSSVLF